MKKINQLFIIFCVLVFLCIALWYAKSYAVNFYLYIDTVKTYLKDTVQCCPGKALSLYVCVYIFCAACVMPVLMPLTLFGGMLFGTFVGSLAAIIASTIGALISFLVIKKFFLSLMSVKYQRATEEMGTWIGQRGIFSALVILHLLTIVPYVVINTIAAILGVSVPLFIATALFGSAPVMVVYAFAGAQFSALNSIKDVFSPAFLCATFLFICCLLLPPLFYKIKKNMQY